MINIRKIAHDIFFERSLNTPEMRTGDIILTGERSFNSRFIRFMTLSKYSHALVYAGNGMAYEALPTGVVLTAVNDLFFSKKNCIVLRWRHYITFNQREAIVDYLRTQIGVQYSKSEAAKSWGLAGYLFKKNSNKQFCSRLVCRAYEKADLYITPRINFTDPKKLKTENTIEIKSASKPSRPKQNILAGLLFEPELNIADIGNALHYVRTKLEGNHAVSLNNLSESIGRLGETSLKELDSIVKDLTSSSLGWISFAKGLQIQSHGNRKILCEMIMDGFEENILLNSKLLNEIEKNLGPHHKITLEIKNSIKENMRALRDRNLAAVYVSLQDGYVGLRNAEGYGDVEEISDLIIKSTKKLAKETGWSHHETTLERILEDCSKSDKVDLAVLKVLTELNSRRAISINHPRITMSTKNGKPNKFTRELCYAINCNLILQSKSSALAVELITKLCDKSIDEYLKENLNKRYREIDLKKLEHRDILYLMWSSIKKQLDPAVTEREFMSMIEHGNIQHDNTRGII